MSGALGLALTMLAWFAIGVVIARVASWWLHRPDEYGDDYHDGSFTAALIVLAWPAYLLVLACLGVFLAAAWVATWRPRPRRAAGGEGGEPRG